MLTNKLTGAGAADKTYIEDVFSTYLYTGNGSSGQTITNGIDLAGKGGLVWTKDRSTGDHALIDSARGRLWNLASNTIDAQGGFGNINSPFGNSNGYTLTNAASITNSVSTNYASWTFRKAPKFFDVVTYTGNSVYARQINHSLGTVPGLIMIKKTNSSGDWAVAARYPSATNGFIGGLSLNSTAAALGTGFWPDAGALTSTTFRPAGITDGSYYQMNDNGATYVAYLFAHDTSADGLIQCGSYTGNNNTNGPEINLGWEPQYVMIKRVDAAADWMVIDNMRGFDFSTTSVLWPNLSGTESVYSSVMNPTSTGFKITTASSYFNASGGTYIYMAIRRGPMKTPTDGTKVFYPRQNAGSFNADADFNNSEQADLFIYRPYRSATTTPAWLFADRLRGYPDSGYPILDSSSAAAEVSRTTDPYIYNTTYSFGKLRNFSPASGSCLFQFKRAPGFFDVVCYKGTAQTRTINHNLGVAPELIIVKNRSTATNWAVGSALLNIWQPLTLNGTGAKATNEPTWFTYSDPTATDFSVGGSTTTNDSASTYVAYLFASCPGVSKVGSFTGNGSTQTINCGFTNGARFVLIKRTDSTSNWMVWDTARGITTTSDPLLLLNSTAAETSGADQIQPNSTGFTVQYAGPSTDSAPNINGATYIYLAIA